MQTKQIESVHTDISQLDADIIGMEEVRDFDKAGLAVQPLAGFKADVCANFPPREGQREAQQTAIASRLQPLSAWSELWKPHGAMQPPRGFAFAAYQLSSRDLLLVYCVHFKSNRGDPLENIALRQESAHQLLAHVAATSKAYEKVGRLTWIIGGDFNTSPDDTRFAGETTLPELLKAGFGWSWQGMPFTARITLPSEHQFPPACFDHIFYRGLKLRRAAVINTSPRSSDHRAIVATFELPNN
jgi:endonuclease/exonuclease/phosphatase (EEP) superfamily protein YafD